jgi:hypothetical protein
MKAKLSILALGCVLAVGLGAEAQPSYIHVTEGKGKVVCIDGCAVYRYQVTLAVSHPGRSVMTVSEGLLAPVVYNVGCVGVFPTKWGHNVIVSGSRVTGGFAWLVLSDHKSGKDYAAVGLGQRSPGICDSPVDSANIDLKINPAWVVKPGSYTTKP